jgi:hypothetical protein
VRSGQRCIDTALQTGLFAGGGARIRSFVGICTYVYKYVCGVLPKAVSTGKVQDVRAGNTRLVAIPIDPTYGGGAPTPIPSTVGTCVQPDTRAPVHFQICEHRSHGTQMWK